MSALRVFFSSDIFLPRGYALGWEPVLLVADALSQLLLAVAGVALLLRAAKRRSPRLASGDGAPDATKDVRLAPRALGVFGGLLLLSGVVETIGLWRAWPGLSALLRCALGATALFALRERRPSARG